jgi:formylglycine-generating enzyme required for sulfatase activity
VSAPDPAPSTHGALSSRSRLSALSPEGRFTLSVALAAGLGAGFERTEAPDTPLGWAFEHHRSGATMLALPGGRFLMGRDAGELDERPTREVEVAPFLIARAPIDQAAWDRLGGQDERSWRQPDLPIVGLSWDDAQAWLTQAGDGLRLPSEAEWEYACRAGTTTLYSWGDEVDPARCWYGGNAFVAPRPHASEEHVEQPNPFGLIDASGNAFEWCLDGWLDDYRDAPSDAAPRSSDSPYRVARGGAWDDHCDHCCSSFRYKAPHDSRERDFGLRPARALPGLHEQRI